MLECAVVAIPDAHWGERPKAFVTLREEASATAKEIIAFVRERLAHYKCPDAIEFGPLPKTSTGKVQKYILREREWGRSRHSDRRGVVSPEPTRPARRKHEYVHTARRD